ncbi:hypothetical protein L3Q82_016759 [Scortum barcoo]|uniref:Uncharacterized protein n=1 Tax=Scortum barcoo TaxID=214431 RepID=A0ACB8X7G9_9TELE|nr:hypothetical protein L3Q82_016759 [Scortum barcoo]
MSQYKQRVEKDTQRAVIGWRHSLWFGLALQKASLDICGVVLVKKPLISLSVPLCLCHPLSLSVSLLYLSAHRVVLAAGGDYFRALLCGGLRESTEDVVCLRGVESCVIESILFFIYTGELRLGWSQIWGAHRGTVSVPAAGGALTVHRLPAGQNGWKHLASLLERRFKDVPFSLLDKLLEKDSLCVESEIVVFRAVVSWVEDNPKKRLPLLPGLLNHVRLPLLSYSEAPGCSELQPPLQKPWGQSIAEGPPKPPGRSLSHPGSDTASVFLNSKLYVLGGRKYYGALDILKSAFRFDLSQCKWERLPDMLCQRDYFSAVCLDGKVFVLGGNCDDSQYLDAVEYYTPEENAWRRAHPLDVAVCGHAAAVLDGEIYISGGCDPHQRCLSSMWHYHPSRGCSTRAPMTSGVGRAGHVMLALGRGLVVAGGLKPLWMGFGDQLYSVSCMTPHVTPGPPFPPCLDLIYRQGELCLEDGYMSWGGHRQIQQGILNGCIAMTL